jgi:hypothetical protein
MLCLLEVKHSRSTPGRHDRTNPPLKLEAGTWDMRKKPSLFKTAETWEGEILVSERKMMFGGLET